MAADQIRLNYLDFMFSDHPDLIHNAQSFTNEHVLLILPAVTPLLNVPAAGYAKN